MRAYLVTKIEQDPLGHKSDNKFFIHFQRPTGEAYIAEEITSEPVSNFIPGKVNEFEVTSRGNGGKKDWVKFISAYSGRVSKSDIDVAVASYRLASDLLGASGPYSLEDLDASASVIAERLINLAKNLPKDDED